MNTIIGINHNGLQPKTPDKDFQLGLVFSLPSLKELPESFSLGTLRIDDQGAAEEDDFCSAYSSDGMSALQEEVILAHRWTFAVTKMIEGNIDGFGAQMRSAMKAHATYGAIEESDLNEIEKGLSPYQARNIKNYRQELFQKALKHKKQTFFDVVSPYYDRFDTARAAIWKFREKKQTIAIGVQFGWPLEQYILDTIPQIGGGHMMYATGWDNDGLEIVNSYGLKAGKGGKHRITREVWNHFAPMFGSMMMVDMPREEAEMMLEHGIKDDDGIVIGVSKIWWTSIKKVLPFKPCRLFQK